MSATVLYLVDSLGLSGKTRALASLATGLDPARYRAEVCYLTEEQSALSGHLRERGVPLHYLPVRTGLDFSVAARLLYRMVREIRPEVVHCYNPRPMLYGGLAARLAAVPAVGSLSAFACQVPDQKYDFLPQPLHTASSRNRWRNRAIAHLMRHLLVVSFGLGERFCRWNGLPLDKLRVVPYGANVEEVRRVATEEVRAARERLGLREGEVLIGSVGRLVEQKDYPTQLRAFAQAAAQVEGLRMILIGDGPLRRELEDLAAGLGVRDRIIFFGHSDQVPLLLRALDVFVLASQFEPFGVALLEAKAAGLPIVATRVNEVSAILSHGQCGVLISPREPDEMGRAFVALATDPALRQRLGQQALLEARVRHDLRGVHELVQQIYDEVRS